jgi:hypothetical protein
MLPVSLLEGLARVVPDFSGSGFLGERQMSKSVVFGAAVAFVFAANVSAAAPLGHGAPAMIEANATLSLVEEVHGTHRSCRRGWVPRWHVVRWHRHVGVSRVAVRC